MSAPTPAPGDDRPREGYYPDPSIPGYVRYWNGASWVPGTSRPAPAAGEPLSPPSGGPAGPVEETGPHFFDEDPGAGDPAPAAGEQYGSRPEPATAWGADRNRQSGFGGDQDRRVSWGSPESIGQSLGQSADPRLAHTSDPGDGGPPVQPDGQSSRTDGIATIPPADGDTDVPPSGNTFVFRRPTPGPAATADSAGGPADDGTMTFRALSRPGGQRPGGTGAPDPTRQPAAQNPSPGGPSGPGFRAGQTAADRAATGQPGPAGPMTPGLGQQGPAQQGPVQPGAAPAAAQAGTAQAQAPAVPQQQSVPNQSVPQQPAAPLAGGVGGGQSSWAQQVHRLAGASGDEPVTPWRPPADDPFHAMLRRQAEARPASLGKRFAARLIDTLAILAVTAVAAVPLGTRAMDHVNGKIDEAKLSGETVTVWLLDGTTGMYLGIIVAVLLLFGVLYEALPTAKWGRTLGKRLLGLEVRDIELHDAPSFGSALRRWVVFSVPGLLCFGLVGVVWCLFDKPWHQCWHDKAARTFVAG
ncbi:RDD family protein [Streptomyces sp. NPDC088387]|uniref:RDD family protein n=1 Tax=Streptomyces sp. NPDC088387 TaxID=3365859 RepID=UPI00382D5A18